jgi:hypothetical protein
MERTRQVAKAVITIAVIVAFTFPLYGVAGPRLEKFKEWGTDIDEHRCFDFLEYKKLVTWVDELDRYDALSAAHEGLLLSNSGEVGALRRALAARDRQIQVLEKQNHYLRGSLKEELAKPRLPYPEWFEPVRIGIELGMAGTIITETIMLILAAKGFIF